MPYISATAEIMYAPLDLRFVAIASSPDYLKLLSPVLQVIEERDARILIVELRQFAHDLLATLVLQMRDHHGDSHDLVAALAGVRGTLHAAIAHAQLLAALGSRRNLELGTPIDRGHVDLGAKRSLRNRNRNRDVNIVARPGKHRMRASAHDDKQVPGRSPIRTGVAFALQTNALSVARPGLDAEVDRLRFAHGALAMARGTVIGDAAGSIAARARDVEFHASAHLRHLAGAVALGTSHGTAGVRLPVAGGAGLLAMDLQTRLAAANGRPEIDGGLILEVGARLRAARTLIVRAAEDAGEDVFEVAPGGRACTGLRSSARTGKTGKVEPFEVDRRTATPLLLPSICLGLRGIDLVGVETELVVNLALLFVAQDVVGFGDFFELLFGLLVPGIDVGVISARSFAKGLSDL